MTAPPTEVPATVITDPSTNWPPATVIVWDLPSSATEFGENPSIQGALWNTMVPGTAVVSPLGLVTVIDFAPATVELTSTVMVVASTTMRLVNVTSLLASETVAPGAKLVPVMVTD